MTAIPAIERALMQSDLGLTPSNDGKVIRLLVPQLTAVRAGRRGGWGQARRRAAARRPSHTCTLL